MAEEMPSASSREELERRLKEMLPLFREAGVTPPESVVLDVPEVYVNAQVRDVATQYAQILRHAGIYMLGETPVTIDEGTGLTRAMTAKRFIGWSEDYLNPYTRNAAGVKKSVSLSPQSSEVLLVQDHFRIKIPKLTGVNTVKLPVFKKIDDEAGLGLQELRLLQQGYDAETGIFTVRGGLEYPEDVHPANAVMRLRKLLKYFPWGDDGRSLSVQISAMLTVFCAALLPPGARVPMFVYLANLPGSGKSLLAELALRVVHGRAGRATLWEKQTDFKKELDSAALDFAPFLFFDNLTGFLKNDLLDAWLTAPDWDGRILGTKERFSVPLRAATFVTGNNLRWSDDLKRRTLVVDLFPTQTSSDRELPADAEIMTSKWLGQDDVRADLLSCLYALVRNFYDPHGIHVKHEPCKRLASFEDWSDVVPRIVAAHAFGDPLRKPTLPDAGNNEEEDRAATVVAAIERFVVPLKVAAATITLGQLAASAREIGAFLEVLGTTEEMMRELDAKRDAYPLWDFYKEGWKEDSLGILQHDDHLEHRKPETDEERKLVASHYMERKQATIFGIRLKKVLGFTFAAAGREWTFSEREAARHSSFVVRLKA